MLCCEVTVSEPWKSIFAHFRFRSKQGKSERKPFSLEPKTKFKQKTVRLQYINCVVSDMRNIPGLRHIPRSQVIPGHPEIGTALNLKNLSNLAQVVRIEF